MAPRLPHDCKVAGPHWELLAISLGVVLLSLLLEVRSDGRVALAAVPSQPLPQTCACRAILGIPCPACGLTRSFVHLAHGRIVESWQAHHFGWLLAGAVLLQFPYRLAALRRPQRQFVPRHFTRWFATIVIALFVANWIFVIGHLPGLFGSR
jgi:Protein of unknown function (DUF2752)